MAKLTHSVSILIPSYNAADWISEAVESCLAQTWPHCEVIVVDDGSDDESPDVLKSFSDRITLRCRENRGGNPTRNELLSLAQGEWVQYLDADDYLKPDKVARQLDCLNEDPEADVIYSPQIIEHRTAHGIREELSDPHDPGGDHDPWAYHLGWKLTQTGGALFRRSALQSVGGWNEAQKRCQDNELYFRLLQAAARFVRCPHAGSVYRRFDDGTVSTQRHDLLLKEILRLLEQGEAFLKEKGSLTPRRRQAANQNRFRLARGLWGADKPGARMIMKTIAASNPRFQPDPGPEAPAAYRMCFRWAGFTVAERIAKLRRIVSH